MNSKPSFVTFITFKWSLIVAVIFIIQLSLVVGAETTTKLPSSSQHLVDRLAEYEQREKDKLNKLLNKKRNEVLVILRKHFKLRTQNGQLDQALAIRNEINRIEALLPRRPPKRLSATSTKYEENGKFLSPSDIPVFFGVDGDGRNGKVIVKFEHPQLEKMFEFTKKIQFELKIADSISSETADSIIIKHKNKVIGKQLGAQRGQTLKIDLQSWKIIRANKSVTFSIECSGGDGFGVQTNLKDGFATLIFDNK